MKIFVDIDETICFYEGERDYPKAKPNLVNIKKINTLYNEGNEITYWTARGSDKWGCKYHHLSVGEKPHYDLLICDKTKRIEEIDV